jgi:protein-tyrosine-phosphatase
LNQQTINILIVCTGNTCRSPMAAGILKSLLKDKGLDNIKVSSAGVGAHNGMPATPFAIEAAKLWGVDISGHTSRLLTPGFLHDSDLVLVMSLEHYYAIRRKAPEAISKTFLLKGFPDPFKPSQDGVHDPIGGSLDDYNQTYMELDEILRRIENQIIQWLESNKKNP